MKKYIIDWESSVLRDEKLTITDLDWAKKVYLADEADAEIARLRKALEEIVEIVEKESGPSYWFNMHIIAGKASEALAPEKEKEK